MAVGDFDTYYISEPWSGLSANQRQWYDPILRDYFVRRATYSRFVTAQFNLGSVNATRMTITNLIPPHPNFDTIGVRQLWLPSSYVDSYSQDIVFQRYGNKLALHEYDELITYWKQNQAGGLREIINRALGEMMIGVFDRLARNAFLSNTFRWIGNASGTATGFQSIQSGDVLTSSTIDNIVLGLQEREVPWAIANSPDMPSMACITSPGVVQSLRSNTDPGEWTDVMKYANPNMVARGEIGAWRNIRFITTQSAILYNTGAISQQVNVTSAINAGDGAPANTTTVDGVYRVGQDGVTNYVQCSAFNPGDFAVNDMVTIHVDRTNANGVTNGVDYADGKLHVRRVVAVDATNYRLTFDQPIMEDFTTNLGGGVYAYVTKGRHIHTAVFVGAMDGVVLGVGRPPRIKTPPPVDDQESMYRFSWDAYLAYQLFRPESFEVWYGAAPNRVKGPVIT